MHRFDQYYDQAFGILCSELYTVKSASICRSKFTLQCYTWLWYMLIGALDKKQLHCGLGLTTKDWSSTQEGIALWSYDYYLRWMCLTLISLCVLGSIPRSSSLISGPPMMRSWPWRSFPPFTGLNTVLALIRRNGVKQGCITWSPRVFSSVHTSIWALQAMLLLEDNSIACEAHMKV